MKTKILTPVLALLLCFTVACSTSWIAQATNIWNVLTPATESLLELAALQSGHPINPADEALINKDTAEVLALLKDYAGAADATKPTILAKLVAALNVTKTDLVPILELVRVSDPAHAAEISIAVDLVINELNAVVSLTSPTVTARTRVPLAAKQFKKQFNAQMAKVGHSNLAVK